MRYFLTSSKDTTIYSGSLQSIKSGSVFNSGVNRMVEQNTGIDQILEVKAYHVDNIDIIARSLIEFDTTPITNAYSSNDITNPTFKLKMFATELRSLPRSFTLDVLPISQSWDMGLGKRQDNPITKDGVTWMWADTSGSTAWSVDGGDFLSTPTSSYSYGQKVIDLEADVTDMVNGWATGSLNNYGMVVKYTDGAETGSVNFGTVNFFSSETHTIYKPKLIVDWDDSDNTNRDGSISVVDPDDVYVTISNLKGTYKVGEVYQFNLFAREKFPTLTFTAGSPYSVNNYIPTASQYSIIDNVTKDIIVPFGSTSKISSDTSQSFFKQDFTGWEPERFYKILIKVSDGNTVNVVDNNFTFKLIE